MRVADFEPLLFMLCIFAECAESKRDPKGSLCASIMYYLKAGVEAAPRRGLKVQESRSGAGSISRVCERAE